MLKANGNFKLSKSAKRQLATEPNVQKRGMLKQGMIQAELAAAIVPKREPRKDRAVNGADSVDLT